MAKLSVDDLNGIADRMKKAMSLREGAGRVKITVHMGTCGISAGARAVMTAILRCIDESSSDDVRVGTSGCAGLCSREPMMTVELAGQCPVKYVDLTEKKAGEIFERHVLGGEIAVEYALALGSEQTL